MLSRIAAFDLELFKAVHHALWDTTFCQFLAYLQHAGEKAAAGLVLLGVVAAPGRRHVSIAVRLGLAVLIAAGVCFALKKAVKRPRPFEAVPAAVLNKDPNLARHARSWPSGHTTTVFALATAMLAARPRRRELPVGLERGPSRRAWLVATAVAFLVAALTGLARIAVGAHYPIDVLSGAILGTGVAWLVVRAVNRFEARPVLAGSPGDPPQDVGLAAAPAAEPQRH